MPTSSTVYGPVASWRLGRSLGIDPMMPPKTCTFDCVYCQLGKTVNKVSEPEDVRISVAVKKVVADLRRALKDNPPKSIDYVTFSGFGEPTLNLQIGEMIDQVKNLVGSTPVAVLTNASLVHRKDVRANLAKADLVVAKLDAPTQRLFESINRPAEKLRLSSVVEGLKALRRETSGRLALQMMFLKSVDRETYNTIPDVVRGLGKLVEDIGPDEVQINTPTRPTAQSEVVPLQQPEIEEVSKIMGDVLPGVKMLVRSSPVQLAGKKKRALVQDTEIRGLLRRRPCRLVDLVKAFGIDEKSVGSYLNALVASGEVVPVKFHGETYYKIKIV